MVTSFFSSIKKQALSEIFNAKSESINKHADNPTKIQQLTAEDFLAVAGGPEVINEPEST